MWSQVCNETIMVRGEGGLVRGEGGRHSARGRLRWTKNSKPGGQIKIILKIPRMWTTSKACYTAFVRTIIGHHLR